MADLLLAHTFKLGFNTSTFHLTYETRNWGRQIPFTVWVAVVGAKEPCLEETKQATHSSWPDHQSPEVYTVKINVQDAQWSSHFNGLKAKEGTGFPTVVYVFEEAKRDLGSDSTWITLDAWYGGYAYGIGMVRVNWSATPVFASKVIPYAGSVNDWTERQRWLVGWAKPTSSGVELEFLAPYESTGGTLELDWRKTKRVDAIYPFVPASPSVDNIQLEVKGRKLRHGVSLPSYIGNTFFEHVSVSEIGLGIPVAGTLFDIFSGSGGRTGLVSLPSDGSAIKINIKMDCNHGWSINDDVVEIRVVCLTVFSEGVPELHGEHSASLVPPLPL